MPGALEGIRVVDLTAMFNGPLATMMLGDQGADVVKVEPPGAGDVIRQFGPQQAGIGPIFQTINRNKRSVVIDLKQARGQELVAALAERADVFVQNFRPGVAERLGIGPEALCERNPELIYASISGFGETGPYAKRAAFDSLVQAESGLAAIQGTDEPMLIRNAICDKISGLQMAQAITAALFARERGAGGQRIHVAMLDASIAVLWPDGMQLHTYLDQQPDGRDRPVPRAVATRDGHVLISSITDGMFSAACRALELPELEADPRFDTVSSRSAHAEALLTAFGERTRDIDTQTLCARLEAAGGAYAAVTPAEEIASHPQVVENGTVTELVHPRSGRMRIPRPVEQLSGTPSTIRRLAPTLGEHTDEVLRELGLTDDELASIRAQGVIG